MKLVLQEVQLDLTIVRLLAAQTAHELNGSGLLPSRGTPPRTFEAQYSRLLAARGIDTSGLNLRWRWWGVSAHQRRVFCCLSAETSCPFFSRGENIASFATEWQCACLNSTSAGRQRRQQHGAGAAIAAAGQRQRRQSGDGRRRAVGAGGLRRWVAGVCIDAAGICQPAAASRCSVFPRFVSLYVTHGHHTHGHLKAYKTTRKRLCSCSLCVSCPGCLLPRDRASAGGRKVACAAYIAGLSVNSVALAGRHNGWRCTDAYRRLEQKPCLWSCCS